MVAWYWLIVLFCLGAFVGGFTIALGAAARQGDLLEVLAQQRDRLSEAEAQLPAKKS